MPTHTLCAIISAHLVNYNYNYKNSHMQRFSPSKVTHAQTLVTVFGRDVVGTSAGTPNSLTGVFRDFPQPF